MKVITTTATSSQVLMRDIPYGSMYRVSNARYYIRIDPVDTELANHSDHGFGIDPETGKIYNAALTRMVIPVNGEVMVQK